MTKTFLSKNKENGQKGGAVGICGCCEFAAGKKDIPWIGRNYTLQRPPATTHSVAR